MAENIAKDASIAQRVQYNALNQLYSIENEAKLRQKVDLQSSIQGLEKEMRKEIAQALKRSEGKVIYLLQKTLQSTQLNNQEHSQHLRQPFKKEQIKQYNNLVKACQTARWQYMVHRHSCGFTIRNYEIVTGLYKIPPMIVETQ